MALKTVLGYPIVALLGIVNLVATGFAIGQGEAGHALTHATLAVAFGVWARHLRRGRGDELVNVRQQMEQQEAALASQATQLAELHERVDFVERLLAQVRDRPALGPRDERG
jgi:hypothetical protein